MAETYFVITINSDGSFTSGDTIPEEVNRSASTLDIYNVSKQIVNEIDQQLLTERIVNALAPILSPPAQDVPATLKEKLKERGIDPESVSPAE